MANILANIQKQIYKLSTQRNKYLDSFQVKNLTRICRDKLCYLLNTIHISFYYVDKSKHNYSIKYG